MKDILVIGATGKQGKTVVRGWMVCKCINKK